MAAPGVTQAPGGLDGLARSEEVREYEKILKISDEIFSGTHLRLKVPQQFVSKSASRNTSGLSNTQQTQGARTGGSAGSSVERLSQSTPSGLHNSTSNSLADATAATTAASRNRTVPKTTSEIDPIFLTKSDDLVRAELQLQRQRVEKALREQLEHKRQEARQKAAVQDAKPDFDVSDVLNQALELVKPASVKSSDSSDENSFYSSRAPDSPPTGDPQRSSAAPVSQSGNLATEGPVENSSDELQRLEALNRTGLDREMQDTYPVADQRVPYRQRQAHDAAPVDLTTVDSRYYDAPQPDDALDEPDYSPPAPGVPPMERVDEPEYQPVLELAGDMRRPLEEGQPSPRGDVRIVRNHITSPAAPQPSRVSPLAVAKVPSVSQMRSKYGTEHRVPSGQDMERASPDPPAAHQQRPLPRKRRRVQEDKGGSRQVSYNRRSGAVDASEPYIKEEPVSPPPFADAPPPPQPPPALQGRPGQPVYIDIASPRYTPVMERREPVYEPDPYHEVPSRAASRLSTRRTVRDDQDLRRVASLQHARQPEFAREYVEQPSPRAVRAPSYAMVERPAHERTARYYDEPVGSYSRRYVPIDEPPASPRYRETYYEEEAPPPPPPSTRMMAPPPRRIVVDEHGNQFYEAPAPPVQFVSPSSRMPREVYDDGTAVPVRHASVREASVFEDSYGGGRRYVQEMPPPLPSAYRRVNSDYAPVAAPPHHQQHPPNERRAYATPLGDREPFPRSGSVQVGEYPPRRATYMEDPSLPRERVVRMPSVRPAATRYEETGPAATQTEMISRVASVRPGSVYMDEETQRPPPRPEYIERPMYVSTRPPPPPMREEAYYEGEPQPQRVMMDGSRNMVQRTGPRY